MVVMTTSAASQTTARATRVTASHVKAHLNASEALLIASQCTHFRLFSTDEKQINSLVIVCTVWIRILISQLTYWVNDIINSVRGQSCLNIFTKGSWMSCIYKYAWADVTNSCTCTISNQVSCKYFLVHVNIVLDSSNRWGVLKRPHNPMSVALFLPGFCG